MPDRPNRQRLGRWVEGAGWLLCPSGLIAAFALTVGNGPIAAQIAAAQHWLTGATDPSIIATFTGIACLLPGLGLVLVGSHLAGTTARSDRWMTRLMAPRSLTRGRLLGLMLTTLIAALALAAIAALWPDLRAAFKGSP